MVYHAFFPPLFASQTLQTEIFLILTNRIPQPNSSAEFLSQSPQLDLQPTTIQTS